MDVQGGQLIQSNGNPVFPGTRSTGPFLAGSVLRTGGQNLAGLGATPQDCLANVGYMRMTQVGRVPQIAAGFLSPDLVIPAQSLIIRMHGVALTSWGAGGYAAVGTSDNPGGFGYLPFPGTYNVNFSSPAWFYTGDSDAQLFFQANADGAGIGLAIVQYMQGVNAAQS